jgi:thiamine-monophosphate kinase
VELGRALADTRLASAAIDISDGLARDLHRLCRASGTGARVDVRALPVDSALGALPRGVKADPVGLALYGGEDYGLLFAVPAGKVPAVQRLSGRFALRRIGSMTAGDEVVAVRDGTAAPLPDGGFDHFAPPPGVAESAG